MDDRHFWNRKLEGLEYMDSPFASLRIKQEQAAQLAADVEAFLANGGTIEHVPVDRRLMPEGSERLAYKYNIAEKD